MTCITPKRMDITSKGMDVWISQNLHNIHSYNCTVVFSSKYSLSYQNFDTMPGRSPYVPGGPFFPRRPRMITQCAVRCSWIRCVSSQAWLARGVAGRHPGTSKDPQDPWMGWFFVGKNPHLWSNTSDPKRELRVKGTIRHPSFGRWDR